MITLDGREVKVGDRLWSILDGWITITVISDHPCYPIESAENNYTSDGKLYNSNRGRVLFWDEVKIDPPPPPKQKVRKYQWLVTPEYCRSYATAAMYTEEEVRSVYGDQVIRPIEETMIEVEE